VTICATNVNIYSSASLLHCIFFNYRVINSNKHSFKVLSGLPLGLIPTTCTFFTQSFSSFLFLNNLTRHNYHIQFLCNLVLGRSVCYPANEQIWLHVTVHIDLHMVPTAQMCAWITWQFVWYNYHLVWCCAITQRTASLIHPKLKQTTYKLFYLTSNFWFNYINHFLKIIKQCADTVCWWQQEHLACKKSCISNAQRLGELLWRGLTSSNHKKNWPVT